MLLIETAVVLGLILAAFTVPGLGSNWLGKIESRVARISRHTGLAVALAGLLGALARVAALPVLPIPQPGLPDEFGHLLAADTFAHGRLTNPTHPMWVHFENLSAIQQPTYASKYPPAQGLILAVGQVVFKHPFWGVCLSVGFMSAALCWMLQGWLLPEWAFVGVLLAIMRLALFSYWANSYWGGALAAGGGALVLGALPRIKSNLRTRDVFIMGSGIAILANSRPYEGLVLVFIVLLALGIILARNEHLWQQLVIRVAVPLVLCVAGTLIWTGYYNWRITGTPWRTPYLVAQQTYYPTPLFIWQSLRPMPIYHDVALRREFEKWELPVYRADHEHPVLTSILKSIHFWLFFLGPALTAPFLLLPYVLPPGFSWRHLSTDTRLLLKLGGVSFVATLMPLFFNPGYAAPITAVVYALTLKALQRVRCWKRPQIGIALSRATVSACVVLVLLRALAGPLHIAVAGGARTWYSSDFQLVERAKLQSTLSASDSRHLVLVRYPESDQGTTTEWVFNGADIDSSKVIWARDMGPEENFRLMHYFRNRTLWLIELGKLPLALSRYSAMVSQTRQPQ